MLEGFIVFEHVLLGSALVAENMQYLSIYLSPCWQYQLIFLLVERGITGIVNATDNVPNYHEETGKFEYLRIPVEVLAILTRFPH